MALASRLITGNASMLETENVHTLIVRILHWSTCFEQWLIIAKPKIWKKGVLFYVCAIEYVQVMLIPAEQILLCALIMSLIRWLEQTFLCCQGTG